MPPPPQPPGLGSAAPPQPPGARFACCGVAPSPCPPWPTSFPRLPSSPQGNVGQKAPGPLPDRSGVPVRPNTKAKCPDLQKLNDQMTIVWDYERCAPHITKARSVLGSTPRVSQLTPNCPKTVFLQWPLPLSVAHDRLQCWRRRPPEGPGEVAKGSPRLGLETVLHPLVRQRLSREVAG